MMVNTKNRSLWYGVTLFASILLLSSTVIFEKMDSFWAGLSVALGLLAILRLLQVTRIKTNENYAKKWNVERKDERNIYISNEARSKTFYYSVIIEAILIIAFAGLNMVEYTKILSCLIAGQMIVYWLTYFVLRSKY